MSRSSVLYIRSVIFNLLFYVNVTAHMIVALPTLVLPRRILHVFVRSYALTSLWLLRVICGTKVEWRGVEKLPKGACILACTHQSAWETFALYAVIDDPTYILKRELMWLPLFGWYMWKEGLIPVDRSAGMAALARMTMRARAALAAGRQIELEDKTRRRVRALCYIVDRSPAQYAGRLTLAESLHHVRQGHGKSGANRDYVVETVRALEALGYREGELHLLAERLGGHPSAKLEPTTPDQTQGLAPDT